MKIDLSNGLIHRIKTLSDHWMEIVIHTPELNDAEMLALFKLKWKEVWEFTLPDWMNAEKTPSKRLRNVLFRVHEAEWWVPEEFDKFYEMKLEEVINHFKNQLT